MRRTRTPSTSSPPVGPVLLDRPRQRNATASSASDLRLTRLPQLRIGAMFEQDVRTGLVVEHAAETIAIARRRQPWCDAGLAEGVDVRPFVDEQLEERVPPAIGGAEQCVLACGHRSLRVGAEFEE